MVSLLLSFLLFAGTLTPDLEKALDTTPPETFLRVNLRLTAQVPARTLQRETRGLSRRARRTLVIQRLKALAHQTQEPVLAALQRAGARRIRPLWIVNLVSAEVPAGAIPTLARLPQVASVDLDEARPLLLEPGPSRPAPPDQTDTREVAWGVARIRAPEVWNLGYRGQGVVVAVLDTGVNLAHQDLADHLWTNPGEVPDNGTDDDNNGFVDDLHGWDFVNDDPDPSDDQGHGTHCAGIVAGDGTAGSQTGVAPEARIMAIKVLDSNGNGTESNVWQGIQYALDNGAAVLSLSLGWQHAWNPDRATWRQIFENLLAAGVVAAVAAGNERETGDPAPDNIRTPGDVPPPWHHPDQAPQGGLAAVVTVGATDSNDDFASFSSYGPVTWQGIAPYDDYPYNPGPGLLDPDVLAPGVDIKSLDYNSSTGYTLKSGTSMATPHVAGVMALLLSRNPELTPAEVDELLERTALDLGALGKDNDYGAGRVDAYEALLQVPVADHDARTEWVLAPRGQVALGVALEPRAIVANSGRDTVAFTVAFEVDSAGQVVYHQETSTDPLKPGEKDTVAFPSWIPTHRGAFLARAFTLLPDDEMPTNDTVTTPFTVRPIGTEYLVWDLDPNHSSGPVVDSLLMDLGYFGRYSTDPGMADSLRRFRSVWVFVGMYPTNYRIAEGSAVAESLEAYLQAGGDAYLEGGDVWYYDPTQGGHDFGPTFGLDGAEDGTADLSRVEGVAGTFTEGLAYAYAGENAYVDRLVPLEGAQGILRNPTASYDCGIAYDAGPYRTVGLSFELGGLVDSAATRRELVQRIADFLRLGPPSPVYLQDAEALEVLAPRGTARLGDTLVPRARFRNAGRETVDYQARLALYLNETLVYTDTVHLTAVPPGQEDTVAFRPLVAESVGTYTVIARSHLRTDENPANDTARALWTVRDTLLSSRVLVWDLDPNRSSGPRIREALETLGVAVDYATDPGFADSLGHFGAVFVCAGMYDQNHVFFPDSADTRALVAYLEAGGRVYLEGGDLWYYDPGQNAYDFGPLFGIQGIADGAADLQEITGVAGTFAEGLTYPYAGENAWVDHLAPTNDAFALLQNTSPEFVCAVARDAGTWRTVGTSLELGGLMDQPYPLETLVQRILAFFAMEVPEPALQTDPPEITVWLPPDRSWQTHLMLWNTGEANSRLVVNLTDDEGSRWGWLRRSRRRYTRSRPPSPPLFLAKGQPDPRPGLRGTGGPDAFGYTWVDSRDSLGPAFFWLDLTGVGTPLPLADDADTVLPLPFAFPFYGQTYTSLRVSSNGYLTFGPNGTDFSNDPLPDTSEPNALVAVFWDDLDPSSGGQVYAYADAEAPRFVVEWLQVPRYNEDTSALTFEAVLYPDGRLLFLYHTLVGTLTSATVGLENPDGTVGLPVVYNAEGLADSLAVALYPPGTTPGWLFETPTSGTVPAGGALPVTLTLETGGMSPGEVHQARVLIYSNDPRRTVDTVAVTLQVADSLQGDVDGNGLVDPRDRELLEAYLYHHGPPPTPYEQGDVNHDGRVDDADLALLNLLLYTKGGKTAATLPWRTRILRRHPR